MLLLFCPLATSFKSKKNFTRQLLAFLITATSSYYASHHYLLPSVDEKGVEGIAQIEISSVEPSQTRFAKVWHYKGKMNAFVPHFQLMDPIARNLFFHLNLPRNEGEPPTELDTSYVVHATLKKISLGCYIIKPKKGDSWTSLGGFSHIVHWRRQAKQAVSRYIHQHIQDITTANFLTGIATGNFDDYHLLFTFSRFGLLHIMAISGFHFGIISAFLLFFLRLRFSYRVTAIVLCLLMTLYFLFLGGSPSVMRSWVAIMVMLVGTIFGKSCNGLNALGIAMLIVLLLDPLNLLSIAFQLSFLITAAILLFYATASRALQKIWKKRSLSEALHMNRSNQYGYLILNLLREGTALTIAVHIIAFPITLYYFQKFPWIGLVYNLFFPFLVTIAMILLCIACLFFWCPPLASVLHHINNHFTQYALSLLSNIPTAFDVYFKIAPIPLPWIITYLSIAFFIGILLYQRERTLYQEENVTAWTI